MNWRKLKNKLQTCFKEKCNNGASEAKIKLGDDLSVLKIINSKQFSLSLTHIRIFLVNTNKYPHQV